MREPQWHRVPVGLGVRDEAPALGDDGLVIASRLQCDRELRAGRAQLVVKARNGDMQRANGGVELRDCFRRLALVVEETRLGRATLSGVSVVVPVDALRHPQRRDEVAARIGHLPTMVQALPQA